MFGNRYSCASFAINPLFGKMLPLIGKDQGIGVLFRHCLEHTAVFRFLDGSSERRSDERNADLACCFISCGGR